MSGKSGPLIRWTGFAVGCVLGVSAVLVGKLPEGRAATGLGLTMSSQPSAELSVSPAGTRFLEARGLVPGGPAVEGQLEIANYTTRAMGVRARLQAGDRDLDALVNVALTADKKRVFNGRLSELRSKRAALMGLGPRQRRRLRLRAWVPATVKQGFQGRSAHLELAFEPVEERR